MKTRSAFFSRITGTTMVYTLVVVITSLNRMLEMGMDWKVSNLYFLQLFAMIVALEAVDALIFRLIDKLAVFLPVNFIAMLGLTFGAGLLFGWFAFTLDSLASVGVIVLLVYGLTYWFLISKNKADAAKINAKLSEQDRDKPSA